MSTRSLERTPTLQRLGRGYAVFLTLFLAGFIVLSLTYSSRSARFPLLVATPSFLVMLLVTASYVNDRAEAVVRSFDAAFFDVDSDLFEGETTSLKEGGIRRALSWTVGTLVVYYLLGFTGATFVFVYAYLTVEGGHSQRRSLTIAAVTTAFMFGLFVITFGVRLEGGALYVFATDLLGM